MLKQHNRTRPIETAKLQHPLRLENVLPAKKTYRPQTGKNPEPYLRHLHPHLIASAPTQIEQFQHKPEILQHFPKPQEMKQSVLDLHT